MKFSLLLLTFFSCATSFAQTGGVVLHFEIESKLALGDSIHVEIWQDSTFLFQQNTRRRVIARDLPEGQLDLYCSFNDSVFIHKQAVYVQSNQLVYNSYEVDSNLIAVQSKGAGKFTYSADASNVGRSPLPIRATPTVTNNIFIDPNFPRSMSADVLQIEACQVIAYQVPLIQKDAGANSIMITREDIAKMPMRTVYEIAPTVGGVNATNDLFDISIRGARSTQNAYYIDGIRVNSLDGIPKSFIKNVTVITGGLPACYGDATGGVILVEGKNASSVNAEGSQRIGRRKNNYSNYTPTYYKPEPAYVEPPRDIISFDRFSEIYENDFLSPLTQPNSTFGLDVDRASWTFVKTQFAMGQTIHRDAVKLEEMLNSFTHKPAKIDEGDLIGVELERNPCAWNPENELVTIRVRAADLPANLPRKAHNLVLLVDVSGSMTDANKLPLLIAGFTEFVNGLEECDRISIVTYAGRSGVVLEPTTCDQKEVILAALNNLVSGGSTNGIGGIMTAYELAEKHYDPKLNNRIILATDGDFNVGINSTTELEAYISTKRGKGIYLTALGFGMGNYRNDILETLADRGDGNHFYINDLITSKKVLSGDIGNLINIARDVKLNVEFNPAFVTSYRLIGYENRLMPSQDFIDDTKDGGEMGYAHSVIAVYEITRGKDTKTESHFTKTNATLNREELAFVKLRYKRFEDSTSIERKFSLSEDSEIIQNDLVNLVTAFGLTLRDSVFKGDLTNEQLVQLAKDFTPKDEAEEALKEMVLSLE